MSKMLGNQRITTETHFQDTRLVTLIVESEYDAGDIIMVHPSNNSALVAELIEYMHLDPNGIVLISPDPE